MRRYFSRFANQLHYKKEKKMSSGKLKRHDGFNPTQIKDGKVVRVNKNGIVREILGTVRDIKKNKENK
jgi:hypothetical protein